MNFGVNGLDQIGEYLPFLIPVAILEILLAVIAVVHICKHPNYRFGNKALWIVIAICLQLVGPVLYFAIGRGDE